MFAAKKFCFRAKKLLTGAGSSAIILIVDSQHRGIAKLVRHGILNPACVGSSPATPAI